MDKKTNQRFDNFINLRDSDETTLNKSQPKAYNKDKKKKSLNKNKSKNKT